jgi:hypothetical protein
VTSLIDPNYFKLMEKYFPIITYQTEEIVTYRSHIPRVGLILLEGKIEIIKTKSSFIVEINHGVGLKELWLKTPSKYKIKVFPGTKVISVDLTTLKLLIQNETLDIDLLQIA